MGGFTAVAVSWYSTPPQQGCYMGPKYFSVVCSVHNSDGDDG